MVVVAYLYFKQKFTSFYYLSSAKNLLFDPNKQKVPGINGESAINTGSKNLPCPNSTPEEAFSSIS